MIHIPFPSQITSFSQETGYSAQTLMLGFQRVWSQLTHAGLGELMQREVPWLLARAPIETWTDAALPLETRKTLASDCPVRRLFLVTASTVPSAAFQDMLLPLLLPVRLTVRPAHNLVSLMQMLVDHLCRYAPELGKRICVCDVGHNEASLRQAILGHDALNVSGSDETIRYYRSLIPSGSSMRVIAHGHRLSAAAVMQTDVSAMTDADFEGLALDMSLWDGTGCLSPKVIFFQGDVADAVRFSERLVLALDNVADRLPECTPDMATLAQIHSALRMAMLEGATVIRAHRNHDAIVVFGPEAQFVPLLWPRTTAVYCVTSPVDAAMAFSPRGQAFAMRRMPDEAVMDKLSSAGFNYFCTFGAMQAPPIWWKHSGIGTLLPLY